MQVGGPVSHAARRRRASETARKTHSIYKTPLPHTSKIEQRDPAPKTQARSPVSHTSSPTAHIEDLTPEKEPAPCGYERTRVILPAPSHISQSSY